MMIERSARQGNQSARARQKWQQIFTSLEQRLLTGTYTRQELPTESDIAREFGVSRSTARRAILALINVGALQRHHHGKLTVAETNELQIALVAPAFASIEFDKWRQSIDQEAPAVNARLHLIDYVHWNDPSILQAVRGFDAVFLVPSSETIPLNVLRKLASVDHLFVLGRDLSALGIRSIQLMPPVYVQHLADHLYALGHRHIDCLNTQPCDPAITERLEQWDLWSRMHTITGVTLNEPVEPYQHPTPAAHKLMQRRLEAGMPLPQALLCITDDAATGALRALRDAGLVIGRDISVCSVEGAALAPYRIPTRTCLAEPSPIPYVRLCLNWVREGRPTWQGPLLLQATDVTLYAGESTAAPREHSSGLPGTKRSATPPT